MCHSVSLCFYSFKYNRENSPQKSGNNGGCQERSPPAPAPDQSRLSCELRLSCSGLHPLRASPTQGLKTPKVVSPKEIVQPSWALAPLLGCPHEEELSSYFQPEPPMFQLVLLPLTLLPCTAVKSLDVSPSSPSASAEAAAECLWSCLFFQLNQSWPWSLSFQGKGSGPNTFVASPHSPPVLSTLKRQHGSSSNKNLRWLDVTVIRDIWLLGWEEFAKH